MQPMQPMHRIMTTMVAAALLGGGAVLAQPAERTVRVEVEADTLQEVQQLSEKDAVLRGHDLLIDLARAEPENVTFLGVTTADVPEVLRHHLKLADGAGLMIEQVIPDSPAGRAGLKRHDVIEKLGDQLLVNAEQLATLVRSRKPGDEIELTVHREGKAMTITAKLEQRENPQEWRSVLLQNARGPHMERLRELAQQLHVQVRQGGERVNEELRELADRIQEEVRRLSEQAPPHLQMRVFPHPGGAMHERPMRPAGPHPLEGPPGSTTPRPDINAVMTARFSDDEHRVELKIEDGKRMFRAVRIADDEEVFEGLVDTPEQREAVPEALRPKLQRLETALRSRPGGPRMGPGEGPGGGGVFERMRERREQELDDRASDPNRPQRRAERPDRPPPPPRAPGAPDAPDAPRPPQPDRDADERQL